MTSKAPISNHEILHSRPTAPVPQFLLLVEDDIALGLGLAHALSGRGDREQVQVDIVKSLAEARMQLEQRAYSLIVLESLYFALTVIAASTLLSLVTSVLLLRPLLGSIWFAKYSLTLAPSRGLDCKINATAFLVGLQWHFLCTV